METIDEAAKRMFPDCNNESDQRTIEMFRDIFRKGVEFAQRWIPVEEEFPICYESGNWDGLRSEYVLVKDIYDFWHKGILYSGTMDGHQFYDWYDERDFELINITHWRPESHQS